MHESWNAAIAFRRTTSTAEGRRLAGCSAASLDGGGNVLNANARNKWLIGMAESNCMSKAMHD